MAVDASRDIKDDVVFKLFELIATTFEENVIKTLSPFAVLDTAHKTPAAMTSGTVYHPPMP